MFENSCQLDFAEELMPYYKTYTELVSVDFIAASLECCSFLMVMCKELTPKMVLDLGSGFSSFALRYYSDRYDKSMEVYSVDTNLGWLLKSRQFVIDHNLDPYHFYTWDEIKTLPGTFDLIFVDIAGKGERPSYLKHVLENFITRDSALLLDDMHKQELVNQYEKIMRGYSHERIEVMRQTLDGFGRFGHFYCKVERDDDARATNDQ